MPFDPSTIPGLVADWSPSGARAADSGSAPPTATGDVLTQIVASSASGGPTLAPYMDAGTTWLAAADSPTGRPAIRAGAFTAGSPPNTQALTIGLQSFTAVVVGRTLCRDDFPNKLTIGNSFSGDFAAVLDSYGRGWGSVSGSPIPTATSRPSSWYRSRDSDLTLLAGSASAVLVRSRGQQATYPAGDDSSTALVVLGNQGATAGEDFERILIYGRALDDAEIASLEAGLAAEHAPPAPSAALPVVLWAGNSIHWGVGVSAVAHDIPTVATTALGLPYGTRWRDVSVPGQTTPQGTAADPTALAPFRADSRPTFVCWTELTNDIYLNGASGSQAYANARAYVAAIQAAMPGVRVVLTTCLPRGGTYSSRNACNALLRADFATATAYPHAFAGSASWAANCWLADWAADPTMGPDGAETSTACYADGIHPNDAGAAILGAISADALRAAGVQGAAAGVLNSYLDRRRRGDN